MKKIILIVALVISTILSSCSVAKKSTVIKQDHSQLAGEWVLTYITGPRIAFEGLYPENKPTIVFDLENNRIGGNNSCNSYGGDLIIKQDSIKIEKPFSTMMACPGAGEPTYMSMLEKIRTFKLNGDTLGLYMDDVEMMRFKKK